MKFQLIFPAAILFVAASAPAHEIHFPAIFQISGIKPGEAVTIHAKPNPTSDPIGFIPSDGKDIEVVGQTPDTAWGIVNSDERAGWVEMRYLKQTDSVWARDSAPEFLACLGNGPVWWLQISGPEVALSLGTGEDHSLTIAEMFAPDGENRSSRFIEAVNPRNRAYISVAEGLCRTHDNGLEYGLSANVLLDSEGDKTLVTGCCSVSR